MSREVFILVGAVYDFAVLQWTHSSLRSGLQLRSKCALTKYNHRLLIGMYGHMHRILRL